MPSNTKWNSHSKPKDYKFSGFFPTHEALPPCMEATITGPVALLNWGGGEWSSPRGQTCTLQIVKQTMNTVCLHAISESRSVGAYSVTSATGPCTPPSQSVVPTLESPQRNVNVRVHDPNSPSKFRLSSQTFFWCLRTSNFDWNYKCMECCGHTNIVW